MKRCFKCLCEKPFAEFYRHAQMGDGHLNKCKECTKRDVSMHRQANLEQARQYDKLRAAMPHRVAARADYKQTEAGRQAARKARRASELRYPDRRAARIALGNAVRDGRIQPWPCEVCGDKAHAHHASYDAPLLVTWLCPPHHKAAHAIT